MLYTLYQFVDSGLKAIGLKEEEFQEKLISNNDKILELKSRDLNKENIYKSLAESVKYTYENRLDVNNFVKASLKKTRYQPEGDSFQILANIFSVNISLVIVDNDNQVSIIRFNSQDKKTDMEIALIQRHDKVAALVFDEEGKQEENIDVVYKSWARYPELNVLRKKDKIDVYENNTEDDDDFGETEGMPEPDNEEAKLYYNKYMKYKNLVKKQ